MSVNNKRVFYVKYLANPIYADILRARPDVRLDRLENESPDDIAAPVLAAAHAYQIGAARDELAPHFHVHADLLRRAPNLLIVSSNGAGFDPVDVEACTAAGVLVVNQSGGNAHSVAEHALGMMLTLSKRIIQSDRALRRQANVDRNALMGTEVQGKTIGIVGLGNVGRRIAALCRGLLGMNVLAYDPYLSATEMAERGGEKIAPREIDEVLEGHPAVKEAVSFGVPHPTWGEEVGAAVVLNEPVTEKELLAFARSRLADFKVPRHLHIVESIPKTPTGKVQRRFVAEQFTKP